MNDNKVRPRYCCCCRRELASCTGEKLTDSEVDLIFKLTGTEEDIEGNIKYEGMGPPYSLLLLLFYPWYSIDPRG